jgi:hypothetical protein
MHPIRAAVVVALWVLPVVAAAQVYRCTYPAGKVEYTDSPCVGSVGRPVNVHQNVMPALVLAEPSLREENQRLRSELEAARSQAAVAARPIGRTDADLQAELGGTIECTRAKRSYEVATSSVQWDRNTYAEELAMYSACGIRPPERTVVQVTNVYGVTPLFPVRGVSCGRFPCADDLGQWIRRQPRVGWRP